MKEPDRVSIQVKWMDRKGGDVYTYKYLYISIGWEVLLEAGLKLGDRVDFKWGYGKEDGTFTIRRGDTHVISGGKTGRIIVSARSLGVEAKQTREFDVDFWIHRGVIGGSIPFKYEYNNRGKVLARRRIHIEREERRKRQAEKLRRPVRGETRTRSSNQKDQRTDERDRERASA